MRINCNLVCQILVIRVGVRQKAEGRRQKAREEKAEGKMSSFELV